MDYAAPSSRHYGLAQYDMPEPAQHHHHQQPYQSAPPQSWTAQMEMRPRSRNHEAVPYPTQSYYQEPVDHQQQRDYHHRQHLQQQAQYYQTQQTPSSPQPSHQLSEYSPQQYLAPTNPYASYTKSEKPPSPVAQYEAYDAPPPYAGPSPSSSRPASRNTKAQHSPQSSYTASGFASPSQSSLQTPPSSVASPGQLRKAIVIPATNAELGSPFLRAYAPALSGLGITREEFLGFIDKLNRVAVASPPLEILGLVGNIVGMVPSHTAQIVGTTVELAAQITTGIVSKGATELCLRDMNKELFGPRGLKVQVAQLNAVATITKMPILTPDGKVDKKAPLMRPFDDEEECGTMSAQERRLRALEGYIEHLDIENLPELAKGSNPLSRMHAAVSERNRKQGEKKMMKDRAKAQKGWNKGVEKANKKYEEKMQELEKEEERAQNRSSDKKRDEDMRKVEKKREKLEKEHDSKLGRTEKRRLKGDKEEKGFRKILFLIVTNLDGTVAA